MEKLPPTWNSTPGLPLLSSVTEEGKLGVSVSVPPLEPFRT